mgnify:CR=1 FL=1
MALDAIDMIKVVEKHSSVSHTSNIDSAAEIASATAIVSEEIGHGMDRSIDVVGYNDELCVYERVASNSPSFQAVNGHMRSMQEMLIRMANPSELLVIGVPYCPLKLGVGNITLINNLHLDYMERHMDISGLEYDVINMVDIENSSLPKIYDMASIHMPQINHNFDIVTNIFSQLPVSGSIILTSTNDHGKLYEFDDSHDYVNLFDTLQDNANARLYHMAAGLGVSVVTKIA